MVVGIGAGMGAAYASLTTRAGAVGAVVGLAMRLAIPDAVALIAPGLV
jgi:hypothetical protein